MQDAGGDGKTHPNQLYGPILTDYQSKKEAIYEKKILEL